LESKVANISGHPILVQHILNIPQQEVHIWPITFTIVHRQICCKVAESHCAKMIALYRDQHAFLYNLALSPNHCVHPYGNNIT
jgi:hypothetical protein